MKVFSKVIILPIKKHHQKPVILLTQANILQIIFLQIYPRFISSTDKRWEWRSKHWKIHAEDSNLGLSSRYCSNTSMTFLHQHSRTDRLYYWKFSGTWVLIAKIWNHEELLAFLGSVIRMRLVNKISMYGIFKIQRLVPEAHQPLENFLLETG